MIIWPKIWAEDLAEDLGEDLGRRCGGRFAGSLQKSRKTSRSTNCRGEVLVGVEVVLVCGHLRGEEGKRDKKEERV